MTNTVRKLPIPDGPGGPDGPGPFTATYLRSLPALDRRYRIAEPDGRNRGRLMIEVEPNGVKRFYFRYRAGNGKVDRLLAIGRYDPAGRAGIKLADARVRADEQRRIVLDHGDPKRHRDSERRKRDEQERRGTFGDLLKGYVQSLRDAGKNSARSVECTFDLHIKRPHPKLWHLPAADVHADHVRDILAKLFKAKRTRQVNKLRSYLHAAWVWGGRADHDPRQAAAEGKRYGLTTNPASLVPRVAEWDRAGNRTLTDEELALYMRALGARTDVQGTALRFLLLIGCQRIVQVMRAPWSAYDFAERSLLIRDAKGRGGIRDHLLPLTDEALAVLAPLQSMNREAPGPFSTDGRRQLHAATLTKVATAISADLHKQHGIPTFSLRDLRRTAETTMARLGVAKDVRAHLLSHGRTSDVQQRHYDRYTYLPQKLAALDTWGAHLRGLLEPRKQRGGKASSRRHLRS